MSIERTTKYICDGCGKEINHWRDRYETLHVNSHNYPGEWEHVYVYCEPCTKQMRQAIRAIPKIVEASKEKES